MHFSDAGGRTVAADIETLFNGVDTALLDAARLSTSVLETKLGSSLPPANFQRVLDSMATGFARIVDGRKSMVAMQRQLVTIKGQSNLAEVDYGCFFLRGAASEGPLGSADQTDTVAA